MNINLLLADIDSFELDLPDWLYALIMDELYYAVILLVLSMASFNLGLVIGAVWAVAL